MIRSFLKLYSMQLGVDTSHVLTMRTTLSRRTYPTPEKRQQFFDALLPRLGALPGVTAAATIDEPAARRRQRPSHGDRRATGGRPEIRPARPRGRRVSPGYFDALGIPVRARPPAARPATARRAPKLSSSASGSSSDSSRARIRWASASDRHAEPAQTEPNPWLTIVGVVPSVRQADPQAADPDPVVYQPYPPAIVRLDGAAGADGGRTGGHHQRRPRGGADNRSGSAGVRGPDAGREHRSGSAGLIACSARCSRSSRSSRWCCRRSASTR